MLPPPCPGHKRNGEDLTNSGSLIGWAVHTHGVPPVASTGDAERLEASGHVTVGSPGWRTCLPGWHTPQEFSVPGSQNRKPPVTS